MQLRQFAHSARFTQARIGLMFFHINDSSDRGEGFESQSAQKWMQIKR